MQSQLLTQLFYCFGCSLENYTVSYRECENSTRIEKCYNLSYMSPVDLLIDDPQQRAGSQKYWKHLSLLYHGFSHAGNVCIIWQNSNIFSIINNCTAETRRDAIKWEALYDWQSHRCNMIKITVKIKDILDSKRLVDWRNVRVRWRIFKRNVALCELPMRRNPHS